MGGKSEKRKRGEKRKGIQASMKPSPEQSAALYALSSTGFSLWYCGISSSTARSISARDSFPFPGDKSEGKESEGRKGRVMGDGNEC